MPTLPTQPTQPPSKGDLDLAIAMETTIPEEKHDSDLETAGLNETKNASFNDLFLLSKPEWPQLALAFVLMCGAEGITEVTPSAIVVIRPHHVATPQPTQGLGMAIPLVVADAYDYLLDPSLSKTEDRQKRIKII